MLSNENARLAMDLSKTEEDLEEARKETQGFRSQVVESQGPLLRAFLYKMTRSNAFGEFINQCGGAINPLATTDTIDLIAMDYPYS